MTIARIGHFRLFAGVLIAAALAVCVTLAFHSDAALASAAYTGWGGVMLANVALPAALEEFRTAFEEHQQEVLNKLKDMNGANAELKKQIDAIGNQVIPARSRGGGPAPSGRGGLTTFQDQPEHALSWGDQFVAKADELAEFSANTRGPSRLRIEMKATIGSGTTSGGSLAPPQRDGAVIMPKRRLIVRDLLPVVQAVSGAIEYPKQTTRTNAAAPTAEGDAKPESAYAFEMENAPVRTIAHWVPASRQIMDDAPQLRGIIDTELLYGLALKEEDQILNGNGTGQNLEGLNPAATAFAAPITISSPTMLDNIALALLQASLAGFSPDGIVLNDADWLRIRLMKNTQGEYLLGPPNQDVEPRLFGKPVATTPAQQIDKFLIGEFRVAATLYDRWEARVELSTQHADFFTRNLVAILAEERVALAVKQAGALIKGDFGNVTE